jgi:hypothetical protein
MNYPEAATYFRSEGTYSEALELITRRPEFIRTLPGSYLTEDLCLLALRADSHWMHCIPDSKITTDIFCLGFLWMWARAAGSYIPRAASSFKTKQELLERLESIGLEYAIDINPSIIIHLPVELKTPELWRRALGKNSKLITNLPKRQRNFVV